MFFPVINKEGKKSAVNLTAIGFLVDNGKNSTIAISSGGVTFEILMPLDILLEKIDEFLDGDEEED